MPSPAAFHSAVKTAFFDFQNFPEGFLNI